MCTEVLVIDDDAELNAIFGEYLHAAGFGYHQALTAEDGLLMARNLHPDVIILDVMLPDKNGYDVCRALKSSRITCDIPVIFLTCMCEGAHMKKAFTAGAFSHISKPYSPEQAVEKVREAQRWHKALAQLPATGKIHITAENTKEASRNLNEMLAELVGRTAIDDAALQQVRKAFLQLFQYAEPVPVAIAPTSQDHQTFNVTYTIEPADGLSQPNSGGGVFYTITEDSPGIIGVVINAQNGKKKNLPPSPLQQLWDLFIQIGAFTCNGQDDAHAALRVQRRFRPGGMISPSDGNVIPVTAQTKQNSSKPD